MRMSAPSALASRNEPLPPGTRIMSPKVVRITPGCLRDMGGVVDAAHRDHADRATRAMDQGDVRREIVLDSVLIDGMGVAAAHLHEPVVAVGSGQARDLGG